ncbi:MAG TPA: protein disulfide oxidoreductase [Thioalkalivibrio sp.]|nr:protein disulfide oxidoreductase [Thioalkalivibrio sp.]
MSVKHFLRTGPRTRRALIILVELLLILIVYLGVKAWTQRDMPSGPAPALSGWTTTGERVSLADYRGAPMLLHFWAEWCPICRLEQGSIQAIHEDWPVLTVAMQSGSAMEVAAHLGSEGLDWVALVDEHGDLSRQFGVKAVPTTFVIDGQGNIRFRETGYTTEWGLRSRLWLARD